MKQKDIALIIIVAFISAVASIVLSKVLITTPKNRQQKVEVVDKIDSSFPTPNKKYFNSNSINPTEIIRIQNNNNTQPFHPGQ